METKLFDWLTASTMVNVMRPVFSSGMPRSLADHTTGSFHTTLDEEALSACFEEATAASLRSVVASPYDVWSLERARRDFEARRMHRDHAQRLEADAFVWASGAPPHPAVTRLGGVPYMPKTTVWPARDGVVAQFYAQLNFLDSKDLVPDLPGEVLLVFRYNASEWTSWDRDLYEFRWVDVDDRAALHDESTIPSEGNDEDSQLYGVRWRSFDDPSLLDWIRRSPELSPHLHSIYATKAGGMPSDRQSISPPETPAQWRFLGQIAGTWPPTRVPFPAVDHQEPVEVGDATYEALSHGPGDGILCLYLDEAGQLQISFSCA